MNATILVTGASGFIGRALCERLLSEGSKVRGVVRRAGTMPVPGLEQVETGEIGPRTQWSRALDGVDAVVHLAAQVHRIGDQTANSFAEHRRVNTFGTATLAQAAAEAGVRRFIFVSTIKVNGEATLPGRPFTESDVPQPHGPYAQSKWEAEEALRQISLQTDMEIVSLRPPLVYGPGVGANFLRLLRWIRAGRPLPLGWAENRRSMVYLDNLVDAMLACLHAPKISSQVYLVSDAETISAQELIRKLARELGHQAFLLPIPPSILRQLGRWLGWDAEVQRLLGELTLDIGLIQRELGWHPPHGLSEGLADTARWYKSLPS
jgi:nucleoside-diphosphate-sugar epimerase